MKDGGVACTLFSLGLLFHEDTQAPLWRNPCDEELRPLANSCVSE